MKTFIFHKGGYELQESCPKPCRFILFCDDKFFLIKKNLIFSTWLKNNKKKPSSNGIIQIKLIKDAVTEICGSQEYEKIEVVCKLLCSTPAHYSNQLFIGYHNDSSEFPYFIISPPFEFLARKDPHKNKRKASEISQSGPLLPHKSTSQAQLSSSSRPSSLLKLPKSPPSSSRFNPDHYVLTLGKPCFYVERTYSSVLPANELCELADEFHAHLQHLSNGLVFIHAEVEDFKMVTWNFFETQENCMNSVELSFMYYQNHPLCPNKYKENLKKSGKLVLLKIQST